MGYLQGEDFIYGTEWNYTTNKEGLLAYWKDGSNVAVSMKILLLSVCEENEIVK